LPAARDITGPQALEIRYFVDLIRKKFKGIYVGLGLKVPTLAVKNAARMGHPAVVAQVCF
jgi:hypothetical protein